MPKHTKIDLTQFLPENYDSLAHAARTLVERLEIGDSVTIPPDHWLGQKRTSTRKEKTIRFVEKTRVSNHSKISDSLILQRRKGVTDIVVATLTLPDGSVRLERIEDAPYRMDWQKYLKSFSDDGRSGSVKISIADLEFYGYDVEKFMTRFTTAFIKRFGHSDIHMVQEPTGYYIKQGRNSKISRSNDCSKFIDIAFSKLSKNIGKAIEMERQESEIPGVLCGVMKKAKSQGLQLSTSKRLNLWKLQSV